MLQSLEDERAATCRIRAAVVPGRAQADLGSPMAPLTEQALLGVYHGQQEHAWSQVFVQTVKRALEQAGLHSRLDRPPAVCFFDLTGYTRLTEERGDEAAADLATRLATLVRRSAQEHDGTPMSGSATA